MHKNVLVLGDLGLARDASKMSELSLTTGIGTLYYMSPEIMNELTDYDCSIDIW